MGDSIILVAVFFTGFVASFVGSMVGSGGLISIPFLLFLGFPPHIAIATNKVGALGLNVGAFSGYKKAKKIIWKYVFPFSLFSIAGGLIGASLLLETSQEILSKIIGIILLILLPIIFIKKDIGTKHISKFRKDEAIGSILYFLAKIWGGFFGGGGGTLLRYVLMMFFGFTIIEASATNMLPGMFLNLIAIYIFAVNGIIDYTYGIVLFLGMMVGGYLGAHTAVKKDNKWVKSLFAIIVVSSAIKLLFF